MKFAEITSLDRLPFTASVTHNDFLVRAIRHRQVIWTVKTELSKC